MVQSGRRVAREQLLSREVLRRGRLRAAASVKEGRVEEFREMRELIPTAASTGKYPHGHKNDIDFGNRRSLTISSTRGGGSGGPGNSVSGGEAEARGGGGKAGGDGCGRGGGRM